MARFRSSKAVRYGVFAAILVIVAAGAVAATVLVERSDSSASPGSARAASSGLEPGSDVAIGTLESQLGAIAAHDYKTACDKFSPRFFVQAGQEPTLCQRTLSGQFSGSRVAYRIRLGGTYTATKAIVVFEIAVGDAAAQCHAAWAAARPRPCLGANDFAAILLREAGAGWRVAALNSI